MAKRKLKQSRAALISRLYYQKKKLKKIIVEYQVYSDRSKVKVMYGGKKRTHKTIADFLLNQAKKLNNLISSIELKISKYKSKEKVKKHTEKSIRLKKKKGDLLKSIGNVWHRKDFDMHLNLSRISTVNEFSKRRDWDKIHSDADQMFLRMDSTDIVFILEKPTGNGKYNAFFFLAKEGEHDEDE